MKILNKYTNILIHLIIIIFVGITIYNIVLAAPGLNETTPLIDAMILKGESIITIVFNSLLLFILFITLVSIDIFKVHSDNIVNLLILPLLLISLSNLTDISYVLIVSKLNSINEVISPALISSIIFLSISIISSIISLFIDIMYHKFAKGVLLYISVIALFLTNVCNLVFNVKNVNIIVTMTLLIILLTLYVRYFMKYENFKTTNNYKASKELKSNLSKKTLSKIMIKNEDEDPLHLNDDKNNLGF